MDNFREYLWYLLTAPFKQLERRVNAWWIWCRVIGALFDEAKEDLLRARDEGMAATCSDEMLPVHAADRGLTRFTGEDLDNFRRRIAMYSEVCALGGLNEGVLLAVRSLGYENAEIVRAVDYTGDPSRWAEFYLVIRMNASDDHPIPFAVLRATVRKWKQSEALDHYLMVYSAVFTQKELLRAGAAFRTGIDFWSMARHNGAYPHDGRNFHRICRRYNLKPHLLCCIRIEHPAAVLGFPKTEYGIRMETGERMAARMSGSMRMNFWHTCSHDGGTRHDGTVLHENIRRYGISAGIGFYPIRLCLDTDVCLQGTRFSAWVRTQQDQRAAAGFAAGMDFWNLRYHDGGIHHDGSCLHNYHRGAVRPAVRTRAGIDHRDVAQIGEIKVLSRTRELYFHDGAYSHDGTARHRTVYKKEAE